MTSLCSARSRRRTIVAIAAAVLLAMLAVVGSTAVGAAKPPPEPIETVAPADLLGSDLDSEANRRGRAPTNSSGAFIYRKGRYTPLDSLAGLPTAHLGTNNRGQIVGPYPVEGGNAARLPA
jgi:hypothetical protein